jgi:hypothetical protein
LGELIVFNRDLTDEEIDEVHAYLSTRYGLEFSPKSVAGLAFWYAAGLGLTLDGASVSVWGDQSGYGRDLVQSNAVNRPLWIATGGPHNRGYVEFDKAGPEWMRTASWGAVQPETILCNCVPSASAATNGAVLDGTVADNSRILYAINPSSVGIYAGANIAHATNPASWQRVVGVFDGGSSSLAVNGGAPVSGDVGAANAGGLTVGARGLTQALPGDARVDELLGYNRALGSREIAALDEWLAQQ